jgi:hypothetical protein
MNATNGLNRTKLPKRCLDEFARTNGCAWDSLRRALGRARSFAGFRRVGDPRSRSRKIRSGAHRNLERRPLAGRHQSAQMLPDVLKSGDRVLLPPDPTAGALVPMARLGAPSVNVDVVFPVLHGTFGEDGTVQGCSNSRDCPTSARACWRPRWAWIRTCRSGLFEQAGLPIVPFLAIRRSEWERERTRKFCGRSRRNSASRCS